MGICYKWGFIFYIYLEFMILVMDFYDLYFFFICNIYRLFILILWFNKYILSIFNDKIIVVFNIYCIIYKIDLKCYSVVCVFIVV